MRILHTADWHIDQQNIEFTVPAIEQAILSAPEYDVFVHAGDLAVHRGHSAHNVNWEIRRLINLGHSRARLGSIVVAGNHDQEYQIGKKGAVRGILEGFVDGETPVHLVESPQNVVFDGVTFVCVPTPTKMGLKLAQETEGMDPSGLLENMVMGLIAGAGEGRKLGVYHGTALGAELGNEVVMTAGMDVSLPRSAFRGCEFIIGGHIHNKHVLGNIGDSSPQMFYCGAPAPLTWNDKKLVPALMIHDIGGIATTHAEHPIPVLSQMIESTLSDIETVEEVAKHVLDISTEGDRVRVTVTAPGAVIDKLTPVSIANIEKLAKLRQLKIIPDRTDEMTVRFDVDSQFTIPDAFDRWCELKGVEDEARIRMRKIVEMIESEIVDAHLDAHYECEPVSVKAHNWCQYDEIDVQFSELGKVTSIDGPNYGGKSNFSKLFLFARYKNTCGRKMEKLIRNGEAKAWIEEEFRHAGQLWKTRRELIRTSTSARSEFYLMKHDGEKWTTQNLGTASETQDFLETMIGPLELFLSTSFAGQGAAGSLLGMTPSAMNDLLLSVMQRDFDGRLELAKGLMGQKTTDLRDLETKREALNHVCGDVDELKQSVIEFEASLVSKSAERQGAEILLANTQTEISEKEKKLAGMASEAVRLGDLTTRKGEVSEELSATRTKMERGNEALSTSRGLRVELEGMSLVDPEAAKTAVQEARMAHAEVLGQQQRSNDAMATQGVARASELETLKRKGYDLGRELEGARHKLGEAEKGQTLTGGVPCGFELHGSCQFLVDAHAASQNIEQYRMNVADLTTSCETADTAVKAAQKEYEREQGEFQEKRVESQREVKAKADAVTKAEVALEDLSTVVERKSTIESQLTGLQVIIDNGTEAGLNEERLIDSKADITDKIEDLMHSLGGRDEDEWKLAALRQTAINNERSIKDIDADVQRINGSKSSAEGRIMEKQNAADQIEDVKNQIKGINLIVNDLSFVADSLHRSGIPFLLLEQFGIPALKSLANRYLENTDIRIDVESEKELTSGKVRNEVVITFSDHRGTHDRFAASGMQAFVIDTALQNAVADLHAQFTGSRVWLTVIDEGFGTMKPEHLDGAKTTLRQIAEHRGYLLFISHIAGMAEIADTNILVIDNDGVSSLEVI